METKSGKLEIRGAPGRCPFCHDLISDPKEVVACAACGARHHERCHAEHGACSACSSTEVLIPRSRARRIREQPPKGSRIQVEQRSGGTSYSWKTATHTQWIVVTILLAVMMITIPLIPFLWIWWTLKRNTQSRVLMHEDGLDLKIDVPLQRLKTVFAQRADVGAIRLGRWGHILRLTVDVGVDRIVIASSGPGVIGAALKEPEVEWLYEALLAWKEEA